MYSNTVILFNPMQLNNGFIAKFVDLWILIDHQRADMVIRLQIKETNF